MHKQSGMLVVLWFILRPRQHPDSMELNVRAASGRYVGKYLEVSCLVFALSNILIHTRRN
jgi:hypothetical protein